VPRGFGWELFWSHQARLAVWCSLPRHLPPAKETASACQMLVCHIFPSRYCHHISDQIIQLNFQETKLFFHHREEDEERREAALTQRACQCHFTGIAQLQFSRQLFCEPSPLAFGDDFYCSVNHLDGRLIANRIQQFIHPVGSVFHVCQRSSRKIVGTQVGAQRKIDEQERFVIASIGRGCLIVFIVVVNAGLLQFFTVDIDASRHRRTPGAHAHIDLLLQGPGQVVSKSRLLHPIAQIKSVAAANHKSVSRFHGREPMLF
jgi:hypothetical protein